MNSLSAGNYFLLAYNRCGNNVYLFTDSAGVFTQNTHPQLCLIQITHKKIFPPGEADSTIRIKYSNNNSPSINFTASDIQNLTQCSTAVNRCNLKLLNDEKVSLSYYFHPGNDCTALHRYSTALLKDGLTLGQYSLTLDMYARAFYRDSITLTTGSLNLNRCGAALTADAASLPPYSRNLHGAPENYSPIIRYLNKIAIKGFIYRIILRKSRPKK